MNVNLLIDSIVRQTTVLIAQLATAGGGSSLRRFATEDQSVGCGSNGNRSDCIVWLDLPASGERFLQPIEKPHRVTSEDRRHPCWKEAFEVDRIHLRATDQCLLPAPRNRP